MKHESQKMNPYVGPRPFERMDENRFFGREREVNEILSLIIAHRALLLHAPSGAGKTSLLNAGLLPLLGKEGFEILPVARVRGLIPEEINPEEIQNIYVFNALMSWAEKWVNHKKLCRTSLASFLNERKPLFPEESLPLPYLIIFDQFEELFTFYQGRWTEREDFFMQVAEALDKDPLMWVLFIIREDHLANFDSYAHLLPKKQQIRYRLDYLKQKAACRAVERPLKETGRFFAEGVAARLVQELLNIRVEGALGETIEAKGEYVEPVQLQVVCQKLWANLPEGVTIITEDHIQTFGDVDEALKCFYDESIDSVAKEKGIKKGKLRAWFERQIITQDGTRGTVFRGRKQTGGIPNTAVEALEDQHIIRGEMRAGGHWYELTHDRFIRPIKASNEVWKRRRSRLHVVSAMAVILLAIMGVLAIRWFQDHRRVEGQIDNLMAIHQTDPETARQRARPVLIDVAGYLWQRGGGRELARLEKVMKKAEPLIPEDFGADPRMTEVMPRVPEEVSWPLTAIYNPERGLNEKWLLYYWRCMAYRLASSRGVPVPTELKLKTNDFESPDKIIVVCQSAADSPAAEKVQTQTKVEVPAMPGFVVVTEDGMPSRLRGWFDGQKNQWEPLKALRHGGPWWLVPRWTQPIFEVSGHPAASQEAAIVEAIANAMLGHPEQVLHLENIGYLLSRLRDRFPQTVDEALVARGGLDGLIKDLSAFVRQDHSLCSLEYLLDTLAAYPRAEYPSEDAADRAWKYYSSAVPVESIPLTGARLNKTTEVLKAVSGVEEIRPYRDTVNLIELKDPVRVYLGRASRRYFVTAEDKLRPEVIEALVDLRGDVFKRFGIMLPVIKFKEDPSGRLSNAFRIEVLSQSSDQAETAPLEVVEPQHAVNKLLQELRWRYLKLRSWFINAEYVLRQVGFLPAELRQWLLDHYTLTDIKSILRRLVAPSDAELKAFSLDADAALRHTMLGQSLRELDWLLASLVFWSEAGDPLNCDEMASRLRQIQDLRLSKQYENFLQGPVAAQVLAGIEALETGDCQRAEKTFRDAVAEGREAAIRAFLSSYPRRRHPEPGDELAGLCSACTPFEQPGQLAKPKAISIPLRYEIEDFISRQGETLGDSDMVLLEYCLLEHYAANSYLGHMKKSLVRLSQPRFRDLLAPDQEYALGFWALELHGETLFPPEDLVKAEAWLARAFREWTNDRTAQSAFLELIYRYKSQRSPAWYFQLLERLADLRPHDYWIALWLAQQLAEGRSIDEAKRARIWLDRAEKLLAESPDLEIHALRLRDWQDYIFARMDVTKASFTPDEQERKREIEEAIRLLESLIDRLTQSGTISVDGWPGREACELLIETQLFNNDVRAADTILRNVSTQQGLRGRSEFVGSQLLVYLAQGQTEAMLKLAKQAVENTQLDHGNALFQVALARLISDHPEAEASAREFLLTSEHPYRDYIRLMLYWSLMRQEKPDQAQVYLEDRWRLIDPESWPQRAKHGDPLPWREQLIGYYLGRVQRKTVFAPLRSRPAFDASWLSQIGVQGLTHEGARCEAFFYDALLQQVTGDPATRAKRYSDGLRQVLQVGRANLYEYAMARYLLRRSEDSVE